MKTRLSSSTVDTHSTSSLSPTLPLLPLEIKTLILRFCDPSTLSTTSRVSFAFLQLSSPLLYRDIHIVGNKRMQKFFSARDELCQPHLHPYLDLISAESLHFEMTTEEGQDSDSEEEEEEEYELSTHRLSSSPSLQLTLQHLSISYPNPSTVGDSHGFISTVLLPLLNPTHVDVTRIEPPRWTDDDVVRLDLGNTPWPNLRSISFFGGSISENFLGNAGFLEAGKEERRLTVLFDLSRHKDGSSKLSKTSLELLEKDVTRHLGQSRQGGNILGSGRLKELVMRVGTEKKKDELMRWVGLLEIDEEMLREWRSRVRFEVTGV